MAREDDELRRRIQALTEFHNSIAALLEISDVNPNAWAGQPAIAPKPGRESDWRQAKANVDRVAPKAARSFETAGMFVEWKPPGTWNTYRINPAVQWGTILEPDPRFGVDVLEACINQTLGALEDRLHDPATRLRPSLPSIQGRHVSAVFKWIAGIGAAVVAAGIAAWLGWVG